ncbi:MAG: nuclear transport factor 2 family protein [Pseudomonadota bacterium]
MKHAGIALAALLFTGCTQTLSDPTQEAEAAFEQYVTAINNGDASAVASMYDDNPGFHWVERGSVQYTSGEAAVASFEELVASGSTPRMTTGTIQVAALGSESALVSTHFDLALLDEAGAVQFSFDGWMTVGMVKRDSGWKIAGGQTGPGAEAE